MAHRRPDGEKRRRLWSDEIAHAPQFVTAGVVTLGIAAQAFPAALCDQPCLNTRGGDPALLPPNFDIDTVPIRTNYGPVVTGPVVAGGTIVR